jgi:ParB-like chromosome segregation protein Spo0J
LPYSAKFEIQLAGLKSLIAEKDRRIADLEADRAQLREDRHRLTENWQDERLRLLKLIEDQTCTVKLLTDERAKLTAEIQRTFWQRVFRRKPRVAAA